MTIPLAASDVGLIAVFAAGLVSFLSPCVLPLVPGYLAAISGVSPNELEAADWRRVLPPALLFVATFSVIFIVILGLPASAIGSALRDHRETLNKVGGALIVAMGFLFVLAAVGPAWFGREWRFDSLIERAGRGGPVIAGAAFALAWTPCIGPTLASILILAGADGSAKGVALLAVYSAGLAIPFIAAALAFSKATSVFDAIKRHYGIVIGAGGVILIGMGVLMITGEFTTLNIQAQKLTNDLGLGQ